MELHSKIIDVFCDVCVELMQVPRRLGRAMRCSQGYHLKTASGDSKTNLCSSLFCKRRFVGIFLSFFQPQLLGIFRLWFTRLVLLEKDARELTALALKSCDRLGQPESNSMASKNLSPRILQERLCLPSSPISNLKISHFARCS